MDTSILGSALSGINPEFVGGRIAIAFMLLVLGAVSGALVLKLPGALRVLGLLFTTGFLIGSLVAVLKLPMLDLAKLTLLTIMASAALVGFTVLAFSSLIDQKLKVIEEECNLLRDMTMLQAINLRMDLDKLKERLHAGQDPPEQSEIARSLLNSVSPVARMLFQGETSLVKWALAAFNLTRAVMKHLRWRKS